MSGLLTQKGVLLLKLEDPLTPGVDAVTDPALDAFLVNEPDYSVDATILERNFTRNDLSPLPHLVGRKLATITFTHELRGSGSIVSAPKFGRLLRTCGFRETQMTGASTQVGPVVPDSGNAPATSVAWAASGVSIIPTTPILYTITVGTGGGSGVATVDVTNNVNDTVIEDAVLTTAVGLVIGSGVTLTPTFTGNVTVGDTWRVLVCPAGWEYKPRSEDFETATLDLFLDGLHHKITGGIGTFQITGEAGNYATVQFTYTGVFHDADDQPMPSNPVYETTLPPVVENSDLTWGSNIALLAQQWSVDMANTVTPRASVNHPNGFQGMRITARTPSGGFNPEAELVAQEDFWGDMANNALKTFYSKVGAVSGNRVSVYGPQVQTNSLGYADRDGLRTFDAGFLFKRFAGNDEIRFLFT